MARSKRGAIVAGAALALVLSGAVEARDTKKAKDDDEVFCSGINTCKGESTCRSGHHDCAWENTCKGKGVIESTRKECLAKGGKIVPEPLMCDNCKDDDDEQAPAPKRKKSTK